MNKNIVLFTQTDKNGRVLFLRTIIDGTSGKVLDDQTLGNYPSVNKRISILVLKRSAEAGYAVITAIDDQNFKKCDFSVAYYGSENEEKRTVKLDIPREKFDFFTLLGAEKTAKGINVSVGLEKELEFSSGKHNALISEKSSTYSHYVYNAFIPDDTGTNSTNVLDVSTESYPYYTLFTFNPFSGMVNMLLFCYKQKFYHFGTEFSYYTNQKNLFLETNPTDMSVVATELGGSTLTKIAYRNDTQKKFWGLPVKMMTNKYGLTTIIYQSFWENSEIESFGKNFDEDYFNNLGIMQVGDDGTQIWDTILPLHQFWKSRKHFYYTNELAQRKSNMSILADNPEEVYQRQFLLTNQYIFNNNTYIIYNDYDRNFNNSLQNPGVGIYA